MLNKRFGRRHLALPISKKGQGLKSKGSFIELGNVPRSLHLFALGQFHCCSSPVQ